MSIPTYDVIVVGAGLSGIDAAYHLQTKCPGKTFTVLEGRNAIGGTWDLFRYPGIRSDSDMFTLGFPFSPWENPKAIADGPAILKYIKDTAAKFGIDKKTQYNHRAVDANWSDDEKMWTLTIAPHEQVKHAQIKCRFLMMCSGYYNYEQGYLPEFAGYNDFKGRIVHPQKWTPDIDYTNKKVIVIGSGATAVTLVPEMSKLASKVTMLQRTPTYIMTLPSVDKVAGFFQRFLPQKMAYSVVRWKNILLGIFFFNASRKWPKAIGRFIQKNAKKEIGEKYNAKDFSPPYNPWDQRLCLIPDSDLFKSIKAGKAEIVTDHIERFTEKGILLKSGKELEADLIVTATGLQVKLLGGMKVRINGIEGDSGSTHAYRGVMLSDVPNFAFMVGYTNASWTLKCDLSARFVTKVLNYMDTEQKSVCVPRFDSTRFKSEPLLDFNAGYVLRALDKVPKQGSAHPWKVYQNYLRDLMSLEWENSVQDEFLEYR
ncbi:MAG: NAD(P)/FAD-dependent oxidoreductase [Chitinophagales bacterium]|nr:NAD(P)/FAD-dependent oxidoreductase [Chitinophagales bacterium]